MINTILDRASKGEFVLIAEIGVNYYDIAKRENISNMDAAKLMIDRAKDAGIHAVKFQSYKAGTIAAKRITFILGYKHGANYIAVSAL